MPNYSLEPVQGDPFASPPTQSQQAQSAAPKYTLEPVDGDPFAAKSVSADVGSGAARGLTSGVGSAAGLPGDIPGALNAGLSLVAPEKAQAVDQDLKTGYGYGRLVPELPSSETISNYLRKGVNALGINTDKPTTTAGKYAETIASFVPTAATMGGGTLPGIAKAVGRYGVIPGIASEAAGEATEGTAAEPYARAGAAIATGGFGKGSEARPAAIEARQAGYVLPPASISEKPGIVASALAGMSGKIKTQQAASEANQAVTNRLAAKALGLPEDTQLSPQVFQDVRQQAGQAYQAVKQAIPTVRPDEAFLESIGSLGGANSEAAKAFPKITNNPGLKDLVEELTNAGEHPTEAYVDLVKELRYNGTSNLKAIGDPSKHALGLAQRQAADAVDDLIERNIQQSTVPSQTAVAAFEQAEQQRLAAKKQIFEQSGAPFFSALPSEVQAADRAAQLRNQGLLYADNPVVQQYKDARKQIAKAYDVEGATNPATGDVNARGLGRLASKGRPLTDELNTIAKASLAFPKALQAPAGFGNNESLSALDFFGGAHALASGHPGVLGAILGRPLARAAVLSSPVQNALVRQTSPAIPKSVRLGLLARQGALTTTDHNADAGSQP